MPVATSIFHRTKQVDIYPIEGDRFLIEAVLRDDVHDIQTEVELLHPALEIVAARTQFRSGPYTEVCSMTHATLAGLIGMRIGRGFTAEARRIVGGAKGCHRLAELVTEIAQAAYQLHFVRFYHALPEEVRKAPDVPTVRREVVLGVIPGMRNTCFSYGDGNERLVAEKASPLVLREQELPTREVR